MDAHTTIEIHGTVEPGFEGVRAAFERNFAEHGEVGAAFCLYVDGVKVVDVWGGRADVTTGRPYREDTLQLVYSTTKGVVAVAANLLAQRGLLDVDAPVTEYWPEFAAGGKAAIPVKWLLSHRAGLYTVDAPLSFPDVLAWDPVVEALAAQTPLWEPGTKHGYHGLTFGFLVGEVVRRITGKSIGTFVREEIARPLGIELWIGLPRSEHPRVAPVITDDASKSLNAQFMGPDTDVGKMFTMSGALGPLDDISSESENDPDYLAAEIPAINGVTNARSIARMYSSLINEVDGVRMLSDATVKRATHAEVRGPDAVLFGIENSFGLGFQLDPAFAPHGRPSAFGHFGMGGSLGFADPESGIALGYAMNRLDESLAGDPRALTLIEQSYNAVARL